jgi:hypothetical protein
LFFDLSTLAGLSRRNLPEAGIRLLFRYNRLSDKTPSQVDPITRAVITAINNMLIDLMVAMSHKDWLSRRQRQKQGIEREHTLGKYRGKQADQERHQKILYYRQIKKLSIRKQRMQRATTPPRFAEFSYFIKNNHMNLIKKINS